MNLNRAKEVLTGLLDAYDQCEHGDYFYDHGEDVCDALILAMSAFDPKPKPAMILYAVRDGETGKLVSNITSPGHRFWLRKGDCERAIRRHLQSPYRKYKSLDLVELDVYERVPETRCAL